MQNIKYLEPENFPKVPFVLETLSARFIREKKIVPLEFKQNTLKIVMADPDNQEVIDALKVAVSHDIEIYSSNLKAIEEYIEKFYTQEIQDIGKLIENIEDDSLQFIHEDDDVGHLQDLASEAPIIRLVNMLVTRAVESRASDIHIEPYADELKVRYRIDGVLHDIELIPKKLQAAIFSRIKIMAKLNIAERRLPQDGRIKLKVGGSEIDIRVSSVPVLYGESLVMRLLHQEGILIDMEQMGFPTDTLLTFNNIIKNTNGIILVTGPTGSGKTTTLYGALDKINSSDRKIITVEDPIEYHLKGINQIQVKPQIGLDFPNILRHIVRQDPDVIMIGEIRDLETAEIAIQSALTGHLVFSTLHTNDAPTAITRLIDIGVQSYLLAATIRGILAQRLVRIICPDCAEFDETATNDERTNIKCGPDIKLFKGRGCEKCAHTGFYGRSGIYELLEVDNSIHQLIIKNADARQIREKAKENGMRTLLEDGWLKIKAGQTTVNEVFRVTQEI
ncbi:MAG: type II secretion system protein GspE [Deltaproteobacteria bacterium HGW-Deltaproteobacteria-2]|jgi:general secretion pathway protein E|nr:MAG: type II secretion system protein GspE [Deltaproteobacteria bacterium HGW-Deltaproteobacteria-2]